MMPFAALPMDRVRLHAQHLRCGLPTPRELAADTAAGLAALLATDLTPGQPVYVIPSSDLPAGLAGINAHGWTTRHAARVLQPVIGRDWRGVGPCVVIRDDVGGCWPGDPDMAAGWWLDVGVHEAGHWLDLADPPEPPPGAVPYIADRVAAEAAADREGDPADLMIQRLAEHWQMHPASWFRVALHLAVRAGYCPDLADGVLGGVCQRSHARDYLAALGSEPFRWADRPLRDLRYVPLPPAFAELWRRDAQGG